MFGYSNKDKDKTSASAPETQEAVATQIFANPATEYSMPEPTALAHEPATQPLEPEVIERLTRLAQAMRNRQYFISINNHTSYSVSYVSEVLLFALRMLNDLHMNGVVTADMGKKWLNYELPISQATPIEIGPKELIQCLKIATHNDPLNQLVLGPRGLKALEYLISPELHSAHQPPATH